MTDAEKQFLFDLIETPSPSGFEAAGQRIWARRVRAVADVVDSDHYGNTWAIRHGAAGERAPRLMLEAHADEIGFMVHHITDEGFLHVVRIGGSDRAIARGRRVRILGDRGPVVGVIGNTAIHIRDTKDEKVPEWHDLFVDIGASSRDEVLARGLRVGHPAVYADTVEELPGGRLVGRALDNRVGGFIIAQVLARLAAATVPHAATVLAVNAVQEEIGGNGARMVTYRLRPDVAVVLDVTHATDSPGINKAQHGDVRLGGGPALTHGTANHPKVVERLIAVAEAEGIPVQHQASSRYTGTDTDDVFVSRSGVPSALVSLPMRYMHSPVEMVDLADVERCVRLLAAFARSVREEEAFRVEI
ncbi:M42 family metallopeptidase [Rhodocaloribacter litoris]|uniref:M42 family metallopeptidase n=1 Tax=Rhodocaloribacter litoris TaxID=2558931 RepID=UPI0014234CCE|nr:M42 family metallopeptidase [Rhodocaloribacter litoris]QXD16111.1 M42 family metallopeptidase [Rhodocaloribacter litoris]